MRARFRVIRESSRVAPTRGTCGRRAIGPGIRAGTTGYRGPGCSRRRATCCGHRATGNLSAPSMSSTGDIGLNMSATTAASTTASATSASALRVGAGSIMHLPTTQPSAMSTRASFATPTASPCAWQCHRQNRVSYNGGPGGTPSVMTAREKLLAAEQHFPATPVQRQYSVQAARTPALMPHMPVSVYHSERSADPRNLEATQKPAVLNAPAIAGPRVTDSAHVLGPVSPARWRTCVTVLPTSKAPPQPTVARPPKPAATHPALSKPQLALPYPK